MLFTIFSIQYEHTIPIIHVLMTNKSEELYKACINRVVEIILDFKPNVAVIDLKLCQGMHSESISQYWMLISLYASYLELS